MPKQFLTIKIESKIMKKFYLVILSVLLIGSSDLLANDKIIVGKIVNSYGGSFATLNQKSRNLSKGSFLYEGDRIITGNQSRLKIRMIDGAVLVLGDKTNFIIDKYNYAQNKGTGLLRVVSGFFNAISGRLAKLKSRPFKIKTPTAVIGVKGTKFWGGFWDGKFEVALLDGEAVVISNQAGSVELNKIGWGTSLTSDKIAPTPPKKWGDAKLKRASATVTWNP